MGEYDREELGDLYRTNGMLTRIAQRYGFSPEEARSKNGGLLMGKEQAQRIIGTQEYRDLIDKSPSQWSRDLTIKVTTVGQVYLAGTPYENRPDECLFAGRNVIFALTLPPESDYYYGWRLALSEEWYLTVPPAPNKKPRGKGILARLAGLGRRK